MSTKAQILNALALVCVTGAAVACIAHHRILALVAIALAVGCYVLLSRWTSPLD